MPKKPLKRGGKKFNGAPHYVPPPMRMQKMKNRFDPLKAQAARKRSFKLIIKGFNPTMSKGTLLNFLQDKCQRKLKIQNLMKNDEQAEIVVTTQEDSQSILALNGTRTGDGMQLTIVMDTLHVDMHNPTVKALIGYVGAHFNQQTLQLDLSFMNKAPELKNIKVNFSDATFTSYLLKALRIKARQATTLKLENNNIRTLCHLAPLSSAMPNLINLSLKDNELSNAHELDFLRELRLQNIVLIGNRLQTSKTPFDYLTDVRSRFPKLVSLDGNNLPVYQFTTDNRTRINPTPQAEYYNPSSQTEYYQKLLEGFFESYDQSRNNMGMAYTAVSTFTLSLDEQSFAEVAAGTSGQTTGPIPSIVHPNDKSIENYRRNNRNIMLQLDLGKLMERLRASDKAIEDFFHTIPYTRHRITNIDAFTIRLPSVTAAVSVAPGLPPPPPQVEMVDALQICLIGRFVDRREGEEPKPPLNVRRFSRTFIITPSMKPGALFSILSDHLTVLPSTARGLEEGEGPTVSDMGMDRSAAGAAVAPAAIAPMGMAPGASGLTPDQEKLVMQFVEATHMTVTSATNLLSAAGWDPMRAMAGYTQLFNQHMLQADMFQPGFAPY
eukprot:MONOS_269.1-p1 / transcript=MONOS_269.1 / gene=MONOS_269 / organism=Monocercomonoides_exilis_PA203 / gene_product=TAP Cterminal subfamily protein / transcript_product=TAP Cterminal subfamily protein / location=Mono_scaffold00004:195328-198066(-) / protein_length=606 / sequence_SO=supercontig / SO=protein_coding / is_pseudo=false